MKKRNWKKTVLAAVSVLLLAFGTSCGGAPAPKVNTLINPAKPEVEAAAKKLVSRMTLEEKIGQMMIVGVDGPELNANDLELLTKLHVGGIILFDKDMQTPEQVKKLISSLQAHASDLGLPLFMAVDQEGGQVVRMRQSLYTAPPAAKIAAGGEPRQAYEEAWKTARSIKELGFNIDFAPVLDLNLSKERSYGQDPATVLKFAGEACKAYYDAGLIFSLKHFPGIGKGIKDTHLGSSTVTSSREELLRDDFQPFQTLIRQFPQDRFMVMVGHLNYKAFGDIQASINPVIVTDLLRKEAGFRGIAITDDMVMGAFKEVGPMNVAAVRAVQAGQDILLVCHEQEPKLLAYNGVLAAVKEGTISQEQIDASVTRIVTVKLENLVPEDKLINILRE